MLLLMAAAATVFALACSAPTKGSCAGTRVRGFGEDCEDNTTGSSLLQVNAGELGSNSVIDDIKTVGWNGETLLKVRALTRGESPPTWASSAVYQLMRVARKRVSLPPNIRRGVPAGPWSVMQKNDTPPSGDKHDYYFYGGYVWPCTMTCEQAGFKEEKCKAWNSSFRTFGKCDEDTGLPYVSRDGYMNNDGLADLDAMIVMAETTEYLTLAWWFAPVTEETLSFAMTAAGLIREWFLNNETAMKPSLDFAGAIPGYINGSAGGVIAPSFRFNTRITDCIELLRTAGSSVWSSEDNDRWLKWARAWYDWLQTSVFGKIEINAVGNHATFLFLHRIAFASATSDGAAVEREVKLLRSGLEGSLSEQIEPSGEMPIETKRTTGATYSRMNLEGIFKLGMAVENACQGLQCSPQWDWSWEMTESPPPKWEEIKDHISYCNYRGSGSLESIDKCKADCLANAKCNGVVTRFSGRTEDKKMTGCWFKQCYGTSYDLKEKAPGYNVYASHMRIESPPLGSGSVKKALDFLLPYALGEKDWSADYPKSIDGGVSWRTMALPLRIAATKYPSSDYELQIEKVDPQNWFGGSFNQLLFPPPDALTGA